MLLEIMYRGFIAIRTAGWVGDAEKAAAIADALHNAPHLVSSGSQSEADWTIDGFRRLFLDELIAKYPDPSRLHAAP